MRSFNLLPIVAIALFITYSALAMATNGAAAGLASPLLVAAIGMMVWHDRASENV